MTAKRQQQHRRDPRLRTADARRKAATVVVAKRQDRPRAIRRCWLELSDRVGDAGSTPRGLDEPKRERKVELIEGGAVELGPAPPFIACDLTDRHAVARVLGEILLIERMTSCRSGMKSVVDMQLRRKLGPGSSNGLGRGVRVGRGCREAPGPSSACGRHRCGSRQRRGQARIEGRRASPRGPPGCAS